MIIIVFGVSGCGKTTIGKLLAKELKGSFYDADDFHSPENVAKMANGIPLDDADRAPWLERLHDLIAEHLETGRSMLLACSALKQSYRDILSGENTGVVFVYLKGDFDLILGRMAAREAHYMKAGMLRSQFEALEEPMEAITVDVSITLDKIVQEILSRVD